jgi:2-polyprenyl-6-methoxyphenol hydroxylase-like FAD-dependent oxidoreductase
MELKPTAVVEDGVFVYDGTFNVPYAAAMDRAVISGALLEQHQPEQALSEAQAGVALAPDSLQALMALGDAQKALQKNHCGVHAYRFDTPPFRRTISRRSTSRCPRIRSLVYAAAFLLVCFC